MDALITAGGFPSEDDPFFKYTLGKSKALAEVGGKPMIQWIYFAAGHFCQNVGAGRGDEDQVGISRQLDVTHVVLVGQGKQVFINLVAA